MLWHGKTKNKNRKTEFLAIVLLFLAASTATSFQIGSKLARPDLFRHRSRRRILLRPTASRPATSSIAAVVLLPDVVPGFGSETLVWLTTALGSGIVFAVALLKAASPVVRDAELLEKKTRAVDELPELDVWISTTPEEGEEVKAGNYPDASKKVNNNGANDGKNRNGIRVPENISPQSTASQIEDIFENPEQNVGATTNPDARQAEPTGSADSETIATISLEEKSGVSPPLNMDDHVNVQKSMDTPIRKDRTGPVSSPKPEDSISETSVASTFQQEYEETSSNSLTPNEGIPTRNESPPATRHAPKQSLSNLRLIASLQDAAHDDILPADEADEFDNDYQHGTELQSASAATNPQEEAAVLHPTRDVATDETPVAAEEVLLVGAEGDEMAVSFDMPAAKVSDENEDVVSSASSPSGMTPEFDDLLDQEVNNDEKPTSSKNSKKSPSQELLDAIAASSARVEFDELDELDPVPTARAKAIFSGSKRTSRPRNTEISDWVQKYLQNLAMQQTRELLNRKNPYMQVSAARESPPPNRQGSSLLFANAPGSDRTAIPAKVEEPNDCFSDNDNDSILPPSSVVSSESLPKLAKRSSKQQVNGFNGPKKHDDVAVATNDSKTYLGEQKRRKSRLPLLKKMCSVALVVFLGRRLFGTLISSASALFF
ncbi:expressed unknown protein [Seminavis robusta]|uniref:Uncharacterized protein n=1 Tax=Seminavis robusta TaxID=568900 RepID=A0A9N8DC14_9STRA|nr:expressed unknown protein [Seminavis robusta]|eukprot:Sro79_g042720.1 n/a (661) ;mRNA; f:54441-56423